MKTSRSTKPRFNTFRTKGPLTWRLLQQMVSGCCLESHRWLMSLLVDGFIAPFGTKESAVSKERRERINPVN